jgi:hypothetical protein
MFDLEGYAMTMITILHSLKRKINHVRLLTGLYFLLIVWPLPSTALAQEGQRLSVTPALFEMSAEPLQEWRSSIKVVNPNPYPLTVYVEPLNFEPRGEAGDGSLIPLIETETSGLSLAEWIEVDRSAIEIEPEQTKDVPFVVRVPADAAPGGHFAAFTVSTRPPAATPGVAQIRTAQVVTSLFFVRIAGEVIEKGSIREFRPDQRFVSTPEVTFNLRFQNDGNVHLRPQGDIIITNMWGQERGVIPINRHAHFGNVLPDSIRKFSFTWKGDLSLSDIGRYQAEVTLAYGQDARQFVTSTTNFWVVPIGPLILTLGLFLLVVGLASWLIRWYVRRMIALSGYMPAVRQPMVRLRHRTDLDLAHAKPEVTTELRSKQPLVVRVMTWLSAIRNWLPSRVPVVSRVRQFIRFDNEQQRVVYVAGILLSLLFVLGWLLRGAFMSERSYLVRYDDSALTNTVSSDQIVYETQRTRRQSAGEQGASSTIAVPLVDIVNVSGVAGAGATIALLVEATGYQIGTVTTELGAAQGRTVIVYDPTATEVALALSADLGNAPLSAFTEPASTTAAVVVYVGSDVVSNQNE